LSIKLLFGFISHADQANVEAPSGNNTHAFYVGALFEVNAANLLGLPTLGQR
jgi:hypothetical protein